MLLSVDFRPSKFKSKTQSLASAPDFGISKFKNLVYLREGLCDRPRKDRPRKAALLERLLKSKKSGESASSTVASIAANKAVCFVSL